MVTVTKQYNTGTATHNGDFIVSNQERFHVVGVTNKGSALTADDGTTSVPQPGDPDDTFGNLVAIDRSVTRMTPNSWMVDVRYRLPNSPQIQPPPDQDAATYDEIRFSFDTETIKMPVIYSKNAYTPIPVPPDFAGPLNPNDPGIQTLEWVKETRDVMRPVGTLIRTVNVEIFTGAHADQITGMVGMVHNLGGNGGADWIFRAGETQRITANGRYQIRYRWHRSAPLAAIPGETYSTGEQRLAVPALPRNEDYRVVEVTDAGNLAATMPQIETYNPYDDSSTNGWTTLPGLAAG